MDSWSHLILPCQSWVPPPGIVSENVPNPLDLTGHALTRADPGFMKGGKGLSKSTLADDPTSLNAFRCFPWFCLISTIRRETFTSRRSDSFRTYLCVVYIDRGTRDPGDLIPDNYPWRVASNSVIIATLISIRHNWRPISGTPCRTQAAFLRL